jgi:uncharacterized protein (TIGR00290 family)
MHGQRPRALLSWSSGKDSAWTLHRIRLSGKFELAGLFTTLNEEADRVAMHGVRRELLVLQARQSELPLYTVGLPAQCSNEEYEQRVGRKLGDLSAETGVTHMIFGDLFLEDIRGYRERQMDALGLKAVFPLWKQPTDELAREMIEGGLQARLSCVDTTQVDARFSGRAYDAALLEELPDGADPCGENGEFHTLVTGGPMFSTPIEVRTGVQRRDGPFVFTDIMATKAS